MQVQSHPGQNSAETIRFHEISTPGNQVKFIFYAMQQSVSQ